MTLRPPDAAERIPSVWWSLSGRDEVVVTVHDRIAQLPEGGRLRVIDGGGERGDTPRPVELCVVR